ncbi:hypothetical protein SBADM41S_10834 [Streptomyces badius]
MLTPAPGPEAPGRARGYRRNSPRWRFKCSLRTTVCAPSVNWPSTCASASRPSASTRTAGCCRRRPKAPGGHRRYGPDAVERLSMIRSLRGLDLPVPEVRRILDEQDAQDGREGAGAGGALEDAVAGRLRALRVRTRRAALAGGRAEARTGVLSGRTTRPATAGRGGRRPAEHRFTGPVLACVAAAPDACPVRPRVPGGRRSGPARRTPAGPGPRLRPAARLRDPAVEQLANLPTNILSSTTTGTTRTIRSTSSPGRAASGGSSVRPSTATAGRPPRRSRSPTPGSGSRGSAAPTAPTRRRRSATRSGGTPRTWSCRTCVTAARR